MLHFTPDLDNCDCINVFLNVSKYHLKHIISSIKFRGGRISITLGKCKKEKEKKNHSQPG